MKVRQGGDYLEGQQVVVSRWVVQLLPIPIELNGKCLVARRSGKAVVTGYHPCWEAASEKVTVPDGEVTL